MKQKNIKGLISEYFIFLIFIHPNDKIRIIRNNII